MSTSSEITRISNAVSAIKTSISNKGVSVPSNSKIDTLPAYIDMISGGGMEVRTELDGELEPNTRYVLTDFLSYGGSPVFLFPYSANDGDVIELNWTNTYEYITYSENISDELQFFGDDEVYCKIHAVYDYGLWWLSKVGNGNVVKTVNSISPDGDGDVALSIPSDAHINSLINAALSALNGNGVRY